MINYGRPIGVGTARGCGTGRGEAVDKARREISQGEAAGNRALELITGDYLGDFGKIGISA